MARSGSESGWKRSNDGGVPRTAATSLTDDQVVILDAIFRVETVESLLYDPDQAAAFNFPYCHKVPPSGMPAALTELETAGLLYRRSSRIGAVVGLTPAGGRLWEEERVPSWDAYCISQNRRDGEADIVRVVALNWDVVDAFLSIGEQGGL